MIKEEKEAITESELPLLISFCEEDRGKCLLQFIHF